ncbi:MAG: BRO family protein [Propionibacterium sp.]|nr:BRO family protein [Propionibacterium sp.]
MSTDLIQHAFHGQAVRVITDEHGEPWFVLVDLCDVLGIANTRNVAARLDDDVKGVRPMDTLGGRQQMTVVTEAGMYDVIVRSDSDTAKPFRRWVTTEVLPSIRRTGSYAVPQSREQRLALAVIDAQAMLTEKDERIALLEPPARAWTSLADAAGDYSLRDAAQILSRDHGVDTGQNRLMDTLRDWGWVDRKDIPYQRVVDLGYVRARPRTYEQTRTNVRVLAKPQIRITAKGLERILARLTEAS